MGVQAQIELFSSGQATFDVVTKIIKFSTEDDVRTDAVTAVGSFGSRIPSNQSLIRKGISALEESQPIQLKKTLLFFGVANGTTAAAFHESDIRVKMFLIMVALRFCDYQDDDAAIIIAQFVLRKGEPYRAPGATNVREIRKIIKALNSNIEKLRKSPQHVFNKVLEKVVAHPQVPWMNEFNHLPNTQEMSTILLGCFDAVNDDTVDHVRVIGIVGVFLVATILSWFQPGETGLFAEGKLIFGQESGKIRIVMDRDAEVTEGDRRWILQPWTALEPQQLLVAWRQAEQMQEPIRRKASTITTEHVKNMMRSCGLSSSEIMTIGGVAAGLIDILVTEGVIYAADWSQREWDRTVYKTLTARKLSLFWPSGFAARAGDVVDRFGWNLEEIDSIRAEFITWENHRRHPESHQKPDLMNQFEKSDRHKGRRKPLPDQRYFIGIYRDTTIINFLEYKNNGIGNSTWQNSPKNEVMLDHILRVANHAILGSFLSHHEVAGLYRMQSSSDWIWHLLDPGGSSMNPLKEKISITKLRELCFLTAGAMSGTRSIGDIPIASYHQGRVAYAEVLMTESTDLRSLLRVTVIPGCIIFEGAQFESVTEQKATSGPTHCRESDPQVFVESSRDEDSNLIFHDTPVGLNHPRVLHLFTEDDRYLWIKTEIQMMRGRNVQHIRAISYEDTIAALAYATHIDRRLLDATTSILNALERAKSFGIAHNGCLSDGVSQHSLGQYLVSSRPSNQSERFFAAHPTFNNEEYALYIQQGVSLTECLMQVVHNQQGFHVRSNGTRYWKLITGEDTA